MKSELAENKHWGTIVKNFSAIAAIAVTLLGGALNAAGAGPASPTGIKNVVLVHGAFADGSGWEDVANILKKDGYTVAVVQHPETSYAEDVKFTKAVIDRQSGPVVLVGHSYGGAVITEAGNHPKVAALVYIAAFALDAGESCAAIEQALPPATTAMSATVSSGPANRRLSMPTRLRIHSSLVSTRAARSSLVTTLPGWYPPNDMMRAPATGAKEGFG